MHYHNSPDSWQFLDKKGLQHQIKVPTAISSNNGNFLCQAAIDGVGLIYTPDFICYKAIRLGQLQPILTDYFSEKEIPAYAVYPQNRYLSRRVRSLIDYLSQYFGDEPYWRI